MLKEFRVQGYRGFKDEIVWSFVPAGDYDFAPYALSETGLIKSGIVFGKNSSGKSNLGYALFDIINHLADGVEKDRSYYSNFAYAYHADGLVKFSYLFLFEGQELVYKYSKTNGGLLSSEELTYAGQLIFKRSDQASLYLAEFNLSEKTKADLDQGVNSFSIVSYLLSSQPLPQGHYLLSLEKFVRGMLLCKNLDNPSHIGTKTPIENVEDFIVKNGLIEEFQHYIKTVSDQDYTLTSISLGDEHFLFCRMDGEIAVRFLLIASTGTKAFMHFFYWMKQIERQEVSFIYIDEFDAFYHFALSKAVCRELFSLKVQAFVSSHNTALMTNDLLRPDCYFVIDGKSVKSLPQLTAKDLQWGHNLEKLYRGGAFEA